MTWRPKKGLQYCQTWQDCYVSLTGAGEDFYTTFGGVSGRQDSAAPKQRGRIWRNFDFSCKTLCFYTLEGNFYQVSLTTSRLNQIKSQQKTPLWVRLWFENGDSTSLSDWSSHFLGSCMMGALYQSIQLPCSNSDFVTLEHIDNSNCSWTANAFLPWPAKFRSSPEQRSNWVQKQRLTLLRSLLCRWRQ